MTWELYEVWAVDLDGHEDLIDTTKDLKEARELARLNINEDIVECIIYKEVESGELIEVDRIS